MWIRWRRVWSWKGGEGGCGVGGGGCEVGRGRWEGAE